MVDSPEQDDASALVHATAIAHRGRALLITGRSGAGKSALALQCLGLGATLVSDDRTMVRRNGGVLLCSPPKAIEGMIEARGVGLLRLPHTADVPVFGVVTLDDAETQRLPAPRTTPILGVDLALFRRVEGTHFAASLLFCLSGARDVPSPLSGCPQ